MLLSTIEIGTSMTASPPGGKVKVCEIPMKSAGSSEEKVCQREGGREGRREGGREERRDGGKEGGRVRGREGGREGEGREGG